MNDEQIIHDIVHELSSEKKKPTGHPASRRLPKRVYMDVAIPAVGDWPKYSDPIKSREQ